MARAHPLILVGAGGLAREAVEVVHAVNAVAPTWDLIGFADDDPAAHGRNIAGVPVLGGLEQTAAEHPAAQLVLCSGSPRNYSTRRKMTHRVDDDARYATLVHPAAHLGTSVSVGVGSVVLAGVVATCDVLIGRHVIVMPNAVFTHDDVIGDFATLGAGATLAGGVHLGEETYIGSGALLREGVRVGQRSLVGMGSVIRHDVPGGEVWAGNPARKLRDAG